MVRTQIYLTERERATLRAIARQKGATQSEIIREAIDRYVEMHQVSNRINLLRTAFGLWADYPEFDLGALRSEMDRLPIS